MSHWDSPSTLLVCLPCAQTHADPAIVGAGPRAQVAAFFRTGRAMVAKRGLPALFVGMVPRLLQQVSFRVQVGCVLGSCPLAIVS